MLALVDEFGRAGANNILFVTSIFKLGSIIKYSAVSNNWGAWNKWGRVEKFENLINGGVSIIGGVGGLIYEILRKVDASSILLHKTGKLFSPAPNNYT